MKSTHPTGRRRPPVPSDSPELIDDYFVMERKKRTKRTPKTMPDPESIQPKTTPKNVAPKAPESMEMSPVGPLLWIAIPLVLVIIYGVLSTWLDF